MTSTPLTIATFNVLYPQLQPTDPHFEERKALTGAMGYHCYAKPAAGEPRQEVHQKIGTTEVTYWRGPPNTATRIPVVIDAIRDLASRAQVICLQEVTEEFREQITDSLAKTHQIFFSYLPGNNHGTALLITRKLSGKCHPRSILIQRGSLRRLVQVVDIELTEGKIATVVSAHFHGAFTENPVRPIDSSLHEQEVQTVLRAVRKPKLGKRQVVILGADFNATPKIRDEKRATLGLTYIANQGPGGFQLALHPIIQANEHGEILPHPKPSQAGLCALAFTGPSPSSPISTRPHQAFVGSDHQPVEATFPHLTLPNPRPRSSAFVHPPVYARGRAPAHPSLCTRIWTAIKSLFARIFKLN